MRRAVHGLVLTLVAAASLLLSGVSSSSAGQPHTTPGTVVLDTTGFWRIHTTLKPPVILHDDGPKPVLVKQDYLNWETSSPPADWMKPDFDDGNWTRGPALKACWTPYAARTCLRGKFEVTSPAKVKGLSLTVAYCGGAVVYVNGKEIARGHLEPGPVRVDAAEPYPAEAFVTAAGEVIDRRSGGGAETHRRVGLQTRTLAGVEIPGRLLRRGVNVVAIEIIRAPYHKVLAEKGAKYKRGGAPVELSWSTCHIRRVQLAAAGTDGLVPNAVRPQDMQVWNSDPLNSDYDMDFGDRCEPPRAISLLGVRNGWFSGKVVVGSAKPIRGLRAAAGPLRGRSGRIPASNVRVRYGVPGGHEYITYPYSRQLPLYPAPATLLGGLDPAPRKEYPVPKKKIGGRYDLKTPNQPAPVLGPVVPVWVTVKVPAGARAGTYKGELTIRADGEKTFKVPVHLKVVDWTLPETQDYTIWVELIQSPDTLSVEYKVPLWSEGHWEMIRTSMKLIHEAGSRIVYVPLICHTNLGNEESMVRWIKRGDRYEYDFSIMDEYLDIAEKHMGKPKMVVFPVWDVYIVPKSKLSESAKGQEARAIRDLQRLGALTGKGPAVTVVDPATKERSAFHLPFYTEPGAEALWKPLITEVRRRMKKRGLEKTVMLGFLTDAKPSREEIAFWKRIAPGVPWICHSHHGVGGKRVLYGLVDVAYQTRVWNISFSSGKSKMGWKNGMMLGQYDRTRMLNSFPSTRWRHQGELCITGDQRGPGRMGADFWYCVKDKHGKRVGSCASRYPQSSWRNLNLYSSLLCPGPDGPVATHHFEALREGVQECEARILIERALTDERLKARLSAGLRKRIDDMFKERALYLWKGLSNLKLTGPRWEYATGWRGRPGVAGHYWYLGTNLQGRSEKLYVLAAEVAKKVPAAGRTRGGHH